MTAHNLDAAELRRYGRHLILPQVGIAGQQRLKAARVLLIGVGGLGSPAALYLAAAGVGTLGLVDDDRVDLSNLQRQILYSEADIGQPKVDAAKRRIAATNPHVSVETHELRLTADNAVELVEGFDVVLDGSDNFATRYLVNDACSIADRPLVWGAVAQFHGQVAVFHPSDGGSGGCYRCLFPEPPPAHLVPSCAEGGVLGVLPGIIGSLQASETIKWLLRIGETTAGRLVVFDSLKMTWREIAVPHDPECVLCGVERAQRRLVPMAETGCHPIQKEENVLSERAGTTKEDSTAEVPLEIDVAQLRSWMDAGHTLSLIDVREAQEVEICRIEGSTLVPLRQIPTEMDAMDRDALTVVHCHHGGRSAQAVMFMRQNGFTKATNLAGGIDAWSILIDPTVARY